MATEGYLVASVVAAFLAGLVIKWVRTGVAWQRPPSQPRKRRVGARHFRRSGRILKTLSCAIVARSLRCVARNAFGKKFREGRLVEVVDV
jgi:hypothetical protein